MNTGIRPPLPSSGSEKQPPLVHVVAGVMLDARGRVLLARRTAGRDLAGAWEFPGGKVDPGETPAQALARELEEELGIRVQAAEPLIAVAQQYRDKRILLDNDFAGREVDQLNPSVEEKASRIEKHVHDLGKLWLVAEHDSTIVGTINLWNGKTRRTAHVGTFGIGLDQAWRGVGLGSVLLERLLHWAEQEPSIEKVALGVFSSNEWAIRLYNKFGFIEEGRKHCEIKFGPGAVCR